MDLQPNMVTFYKKYRQKKSMHQLKLLLLKYEQRLCIESTTPLEDTESLTFSFYVSFEESASYKFYYRVNNL